MRRCVIALAVAAVTALWIGPAFAETRLAGIGIGQSPRALMESAAYGSPAAMITEPLTFNPMSPPSPPVAGYAILPPWAKAVAPAALGKGQVEWIYQRGRKGEIALGFIFQGRGPDAQVSDIIVSTWDRASDRAPQVRTENGVTLGDSFSTVLLRYGYPAQVQTLRVAPPTPAAPTPGLALPAGGRPAAGPMALPSVTVTTDTGETTATVGLNLQTFTKHCVLSYPGVTFTLYNMQVVRIHIYEPTEAAVAPGTPTVPVGPMLAPAAPGPAPTSPTIEDDWK